MKKWVRNTGHYDPADRLLFIKGEKNQGCGLCLLFDVRVSIKLRLWIGSGIPTTGGLMRENRSGELLPHMRIMRDPYQMLDYCAKTLHLEFLIRFYAQTFFSNYK